MAYSAIEGTVTLKGKKEHAVKRQHPWIFSGVIDRQSAGGPGTVVRVLSSAGELLGRGCLSPASQIRVRMLTYDDTPVTDGLIFDRVTAAVALRRRMVLSADTNSARLVFGESDGIPGLIADIYDDTVVLQCQSALAERYKPVVVQALRESLAPTRIVERSDAEVRKLEGLPPLTGVLFGSAHADTTSLQVQMREHGMRFTVDVLKGHKTGFYLDQRDSRARLRTHAAGRSVLNCFSFTGGFAIAALAGGATHTLSVDTSQSALDLGQHNARQNGHHDDKHAWLKGDCFDVLRDLHKQGRTFDAVVLDPPKFAPSAQHVTRAAGAYQDLMLRGLLLLNPGGLLLTFSCSGAIDRALFTSLLTEATLQSKRYVRVLGALGHPVDHPVLATFPEGEYLKGILAVA